MRNIALFASLAMLLLVSVAILAGAANTTTTAPSNQTTSPGLGDIVQAALSSKQTAIVMLIEFALGFGLGYTAIKAIKYIAAFIGILILGSALQVWSLGNTGNKQLILTLGEEFKKLLPLIKSVLAAFSIAVVGPTSIGLIVGILVAMMNK